MQRPITLVGRGPFALVHHPDVGLLLVRLIIAAVGVFHGAQKLFGIWGGAGLRGFADFLASIEMPLPMVGAVAAALSELVGGLLIGIGFATRVAAFFFMFTMVVAIATVHRHAFDAQAGGMEYPLTLAVVCAALILTGPGRVSLDQAIFGRK